VSNSEAHRFPSDLALTTMFNFRVLESVDERSSVLATLDAAELVTKVRRRSCQT